jgi:hypothetical protein
VPRSESASLTTRTCWATCPVRSARAPAFFAASARFFVAPRAALRLGSGTPSTRLCRSRVSAMPPARPASPAPAAIAGVFRLFAADPTESLAAATVLLPFDELPPLRAFDELPPLRVVDDRERDVFRPLLAFRERFCVERAFEPRAVLDEPREFDRLRLELRLDLLRLDLDLVCWAIRLLL